MLSRDVFYLKDHHNDNLTVFIGDFDDHSELDIYYLSKQKKLKAFKISNPIAKKTLYSELGVFKKSVGVYAENKTL